MRKEKKVDIFNEYIIDWCQKHKRPIVQSLAKNCKKTENNFCLKCLGKKEITISEFSDLIQKWEKKITEYLKIMMINEDNQIAISDIIKELFEFRNESFGVLGKKVEETNETNFVPKIEIYPFIYATYLLNLISSQKLQEEKISRVLRDKKIQSPEDYQIEKLKGFVELLFDFKYSEHLVKNGLRKVSYSRLKERFDEKSDLYNFIANEELYFDKEGGKLWYEAFDLPVMEKIYEMMCYYGGHNKENLEGKDLKSSKLLPVWTTAVRELEKNGISQEIKDFSDAEKLMLEIAHGWYPVISPTNFHADQFNTSFLKPIDHNDLYTLFKFFQFNFKDHNEKGIFITAIEDLETALKLNNMGQLLEGILSRMVIFYPVLIPTMKRDKYYLLSAKDVHARIIQALNIEDAKWSDEKLPLGYYYVAIRDGINVDAIVFDFTIIIFYACVSLLYNRTRATIKTQQDGDFFEKQIVPYYLKKNGYEYIESEIITEGIKKIPHESSKNMEIDGILIDKKNKRIFVVEVKTISHKYSDIVSQGTLSVMAMRFLVELTGEKIDKIKRDELIIEPKENNPSMENRTKLVKENWDIMALPTDITHIEKYDFKPMIITNVPVPVSEKTVQKLEFPVLSLSDIMFELPEILEKH